MSQYHYVLTLQDGHGRIATSDGRIELTPGVHDRTGALQVLKEKVVKENGLGGPTITLFFSLAPNDL
jgi:hypothetical protein